MKNSEAEFDASMQRHFGPTRYKEMHRVTLVHQAVEKHPYRAMGLDQQGRFPEAAHAASEYDDDTTQADGSGVVYAVIAGLLVWAIVATVLVWGMLL